MQGMIGFMVVSGFGISDDNLTFESNTITHERKVRDDGMDVWYRRQKYYPSNVDILKDTSVISIREKNGVKKFYKAVDIDGKPISIRFNEGQRYKVNFTEEGEPYFEEAKSNEKGDNIIEIDKFLLSIGAQSDIYVYEALFDNIDENSNKELLNTISRIGNDNQSRLEDDQSGGDGHIVCERKFSVEGSNQRNVIYRYEEVGGKEIALEVLSLSDLEKFLDTSEKAVKSFYGSSIRDIQKDSNNNPLYPVYEFARPENYCLILQNLDDYINKSIEYIQTKLHDDQKKSINMKYRDITLLEVDNTDSNKKYITFSGANINSKNYLEVIERNYKIINGQVNQDNDFEHKSIEMIIFSKALKPDGTNEQMDWDGYKKSILGLLYNNSNSLFKWLNDEIENKDYGLRAHDDAFIKIAAYELDQKIKDDLKEYGIDGFEELYALYKTFGSLADEAEAYKPYISEVTNHWYKDLVFKNDEYSAYESTSESTTKTVDFIPDDAADGSEEIKKLKEEGADIKVEMTNIDGDDIKQVKQPKIIKDKEWHYKVKNWLVYGYYFIYDGTVATAEKIDEAREILSGENNMSEDAKELMKLLFGNDGTGTIDPLLGVELGNDGAQKNLYENGVNSDEIDARAKQFNEILEKAGCEVRLKKINFEKKSSLEAFSILESMHTKDSEYIYRDLKEFLIELGYFTRADFQSIESNVFKWIIQGYTVYKDEWPDPKYERNNEQYGVYVRSKASLKEQRAKEEEAKKKIKTSSSTSSTSSSTSSNTGDSGDGYSSTTTVNGITYKNYKQSSGSYAGYYYWGNSDPNNIGSNSTADPNSMNGSGCGPTTAAVVLSGYGIDKGPWDVAKIMIKSCSGNTNGTELKNAMNSLGCKAEYYGIDGNKGIEEAKSNIKKALSEGKPVLAVTNMANGGNHYVTLLGIDSDENVIISDVGDVNNNYKGTVEDFVEKLMDNCCYIIPEKAPSGVSTTHEVEGFESGKNVVMPESGYIVKVKQASKSNEEEKSETKTNTNTNQENDKDKSNTDSNSSTSNYKLETNGAYVKIKFKTNNGVNGWSMRIEGLTIDPDIKEDKNKENLLKKGDTIGKTNDGNIRIILYDEKDAIINNVQDYFKLRKRNEANEGIEDDLFYFTYYEGGTWSGENSGPACVDWTRGSGDWAVGIYQWTNNDSGMHNIQDALKNFYDLDSSLCADLLEFSEMDNPTLYNNRERLKTTFNDITKADKEKFLDIQKQVAKDAFYGIMKDRYPNVLDRPPVVQGTLASCLCMAPNANWKVDDGLDDYELICSLMIQFGNYTGNNLRANTQAKSAIDLLDGKIEIKKFLDGEYGNEYDLYGRNNNFLNEDGKKYLTTN